MTSRNLTLNEIEQAYQQLRITDINEKDDKKISPLGYAVHLNRIDVLEWLLARQAKLDQTVNGKSLLFIAASNPDDSTEMFRVLLSNSADMSR